MIAQATDALADPANVEARLLEEHILDAQESAIDDDDGDEEDEDDQEATKWLNAMKELPWMQQPAVLKIAFALFLVGMAISISSPLKQVIVYKLACQLLVVNTPGATCDPVQVQQLVTNYQMWESVFLPLVLIATTVQVCRLLDIYGRKFFISLFTACMLVGELIFYVVVSRTKGFPVWWMYFSTVVGLIAGGSGGISALCKAYITDITKPKTRAYLLGLVFVGISFGQLVGPLLLSFVLKHAKQRDNVAVPSTNTTVENAVPRLELVPLKISIVIFLSLVVYNVLFLGESRSPVSRSKSRSASIALALEAQRLRKFSLKEKLVSVFSPLRILFYPEEFKTRDNQHRFGRDRAIVMLLCACDSMAIVLALVEIILSPQYCIYKFHWDSVMLSYSMFANGLTTTLLMVAVAPLLFKRVLPYFGYKVKDHSVDEIDTLMIVAPMFIFTICSMGQAAAPNTATYIAFSVIQQMYNLGMATLTASIVKYYPALKTGELYGAISLAQSVTTLVFPVLFSQLFSFGVGHGKPQLPFVAVSLISMTLMATGLVIRSLARDQHRVSL